MNIIVKDIGVSVFVSILGVLIPSFISFIRSHYLYSELKDTEICFLSLEKRFQIRASIFATFIIANFIALFALIIILKISGPFVLLAIFLDLTISVIAEITIISHENKHLKKIQIKINKVEYTLLHRIDNNHISAHPTLSKDDESIVLLSIDEITDHQIRKTN